MVGLPKLLKRWSGRRGSNPRRPAWECGHSDAGIHAGQQHTLEYPTSGREDRDNRRRPSYAFWRAFGLQPHRVETFTFSRNPQFVVSRDQYSG
jgi:hypothetical protein